MHYFRWGQLHQKLHFNSDPNRNWHTSFTLEAISAVEKKNRGQQKSYSKVPYPSGYPQPALPELKSSTDGAGEHSSHFRASRHPSAKRPPHVWPSLSQYFPEGTNSVIFSSLGFKMNIPAQSASGYNLQCTQFWLFRAAVQGMQSHWQNPRAQSSEQWGRLLFPKIPHQSQSNSNTFNPIWETHPINTRTEDAVSLLT